MAAGQEPNAWVNMCRNKACSLLYFKNKLNYNCGGFFFKGSRVKWRSYSCAELSAAHTFLALAPVGGGSYD